MARGRGRSSSGIDQWVRNLGEQIGQQLGQVIAQSVRRTLARSIDAKDLARQLGKGGAKGACTEPGCNNAVLAKGLCRSHYYRARYRSQKGGRKARARAGGESSAT